MGQSHQQNTYFKNQAMIKAQGVHEKEKACDGRKIPQVGREKKTSGSKCIGGSPETAINGEDDKRI